MPTNDAGAPDRCPKVMAERAAPPAFASPACRDAVLGYAPRDSTAIGAGPDEGAAGDAGKPDQGRCGAATRRRPGPRGRLVACGELPVRGSDLPTRQPAPAHTVAGRAHQTSVARPLGHVAGAELPVRT